MQALERDPARPGPTVAERPAPARAAAPESAIVCRACARAITSPRARTTVNGAHEHRFMNPAGHLFHIACFSHAEGCAVVGPPSDEYPWFPGHSWSYAMCGGCGAHLGWRFQSAASDFFGLRLDRVRDHFSDSSPDA